MKENRANVTYFKEGKIEAWIAANFGVLGTMEWRYSGIARFGVEFTCDFHRTMCLGLEVKAGEYRMENSTFLDFCFPICGTPIGVGRLKLGGQLACCFGIGIRTAKITLPKEINYYRSESVQVRRTRLKEEPSLRARPKAAPPR
jgi:hypothetical protein